MFVEVAPRNVQREKHAITGGASQCDSVRVRETHEVPGIPSHRRMVSVDRPGGVAGKGHCRSPDREGNWYLTGDIGLMANMNKRYSIGVTGFLGGVENGSRFGIKPRFRVWLQNKISVELSPGILLSGGDNSYDPQFPGFTGHLAFNFADFGALTLQLDLIPYEKSRRVGSGRGRLIETGNDISLYGGFKFGSYFGILGGFATLILYGVALSQIQLD